MKELNCAFFVMAIFFLTNYLTVAQFDGDGNGTSTNPYQIKTKAHLEELNDSVRFSTVNDFQTGNNWSKNKYFKLMNDINDPVTTPIGSIYGFVQNTFQGYFDGNGKKIVLAIDVISSYDEGGLFCFLNEANISNLSVEGYVKGYISGGICGNNMGSNFSNCINHCEIEGYMSSGGICGYCLDSDMSNCENYGDIKVADGYSGGIAGNFHNGNVSNCANYGNVEGTEAVGGITGCMMDDVIAVSNLTNCINSGNISGVFGVGGIIGHMHADTRVSNCSNTGTVRADSIVGGIAGGYDNYFALTNGNIYNSVNSGLVVGKNIVGGIIGRCWGEVRNCINAGTVSGNSNFGCIVGENKNGIIENCHFDKQMCGQ